MMQMRLYANTKTGLGQDEAAKRDKKYIQTSRLMNHICSLVLMEIKTVCCGSEMVK